VKILLVSSPARDSPEALSLGAASVAAALTAAGRASSRDGDSLAAAQVELLEGRLGEAAESLASRIAAARPEAVGFSTYSWNRELFSEAARLLRPMLPAATLFAGGPEATADPEALALESGLDFAIAGEGETASVAALRAIGESRRDALADIAGVVVPGRPWRRSPPEDPASLPSPWLLGSIDPASLGGDLVWELSRGCPFRCAYCYESKGQSGSRPFPMERIEAELELFARSGIRYAFVLDPTFDSDPVRAAVLLDLFRKRAPGMRWKFELRAELLDKGLARRFAGLDCSLQIGLQSARAETLATVGRPGFDRSEFARKVGMLSQSGASFGLDLIYGLPGDSLADFRDSLDFALGLGPNHLDVFPLALLPGTELAERADELGIEADPRPPYLVRATRELPPPDLARAASLAAACDRFYTEGRAVGWFDAARRPLKKSPSALLRDFASWLAGRAAPLSKASSGTVGEGASAVEAEQLGFLEAEYSRAGLATLYPALRDLVRLHGAWARALAEGEESLLELSYDPEEILGAAAAGLAAFARGARRANGEWRVLPDAAEGARIERAQESRASPGGRGHHRPTERNRRS
jgi:radical SAM superfamily enzyme YgiQ (UPF0313 family)